MRFLPALIVCVLFTACSAAPAGTPAAAAASPAPASKTDAATFTGEAVETMNAGGYTYVRLRADQKDVWVAASEFSVKKGERLTAPLEMPMENFHSTTLNRDFPLIYFVTQIAREGQPLVPAAGAMTTSGAAAVGPMSSHGAAGQAGQTPAGPVVVKPNDPPPGGMSIADAWARRTTLAGKQVTVRGTVVKANNAIMGVNWFHLRDGSGKDADGTNDLTITSDAVVTVGDVVTVTGILAIKKDFGAGYAYEAILEKAVIK